MLQQTPTVSTDHNMLHAQSRYFEYGSTHIWKLEVLREQQRKPAHSIVHGLELQSVLQNSRCVPNRYQNSQ
jgi:hypothetical protein